MAQLILLLQLLAFGAEWSLAQFAGAVVACRTYAEETAGRAPIRFGSPWRTPQDRAFDACMADVARSMPDRGPRP